MLQPTSAETYELHMPEDSTEGRYPPLEQQQREEYCSVVMIHILV